MSWYFTKARRIRKRTQTTNGKIILERLRSYLTGNDAGPVELLCRFWDDQQKAISYQELRQLVIQGYLDDMTARMWQQDYAHLITEELPQVWRNAMAAGAVSQPIMDKVADVFRFDSSTPGTMEWIRSRGAYLVTECTQTQKDAIALLLEEKMRSDHTIDELARLIRPTIGLTKQQTSAARNYYDHIKKTLTEQHPRTSPEKIEAKALEQTTKYAERLHRQRARTIAQTEMAYAYNYGADDGIRQAQDDFLIGKTEKRWCTSGDDNVCVECGELDGRQIGMEEHFFSGNLVEYDTSGLFPPLHPLCACAVEYIEVEPPRGEPRILQQEPEGATIADTRQQLEEKFERSAGVLDDDYRDKLIERYESGTDTAKAVYDKYVPKGGAVTDGNLDPKETPHNKLSTHSIYMNFDYDARNPRGAGQIWFHEHGHYIDQDVIYKSIDEDYRRAIYADVKKLELERKAADGLRHIADARFRIGYELYKLGDITSGIQDIFGGTVKNYYPGAKWGHEPKYWKTPDKYEITSEAFAHMFEASFSPEKISLMKQYLPTAWKEFERILGGLL